MRMPSSLPEGHIVHYFYWKKVRSLSLVQVTPTVARRCFVGPWRSQSILVSSGCSTGRTGWVVCPGMVHHAPIIPGFATGGTSPANRLLVDPMSTLSEAHHVENVRSQKHRGGVSDNGRKVRCAGKEPLSLGLRPAEAAPPTSPASAPTSSFLASRGRWIRPSMTARRCWRSASEPSTSAVATGS